MLNDSRGVIKDWNVYQVSACTTFSDVLCGAHGELVEM
jgi:hypothetical protein